jgi:probable HAF family extracellular repeat protein
MKRHYGVAILLCAAPLWAASATVLAAEPAAPAYIVYDTGTLGGTVAFGSGINELGWVSGAATEPSGALHAALWSPGSVTDLGTLGGSNSAVEWPVKNNHGLVVGISETALADPLGESFSCGAFIATNGHTCLPFLWQNGTLSALPLLGGNNGFATAINNGGVAVGWAETALHDHSCVAPQRLQFEAVQWGPGVAAPRVLAPLPSDSSSAATAINDAGEVVGISGDCDVAVGAFSARHAVLWLNGRPLKLATLGGQGWNTPMAISNSGIIVGFSDTPGDVAAGVLTPNFQAALWTAGGGIVNLHALPGDALAEATGVNDFGRIIGTSIAASGAQRAFVWDSGRMYDLNELVQPDAPLYLLASGDINDRGALTGLGCIMVAGQCGALHTFVAIVAPAGGGAHAAEEAMRRERPALSGQMRALLERQRRFGARRAQAAPAP